MPTEKIILLVINILGGAAVILSYIFGLKAQPGGADALWGGVPVGIRPAYTVSMLLSALGYFLFSYFIFFRLEPGSTLIGGRYGFSLFYAIFMLILVSSAFWMPLINVYIAHPGAGLWFLVRLILALVGIGSIALVWALFTLKGSSPGIAFWLAMAGSVYFAFHTAVLDAVVWAALFK